ncbi:E3 ubiquitin/ISG15 ligase TRIM25 [Xenopus laevis]|uniref:E3 ubiquitin/ISG15 ligase TRIM25 n=2 Tax=Xenopus laevis TaxID=8355 RepID=A0A1L8ER18_XENLA|nr:E3 ubiquitin/ISG15 ligase TRIM25 [Xenopus laevis]OCT61765.1 hypothetical protein XELAEV_18047794mg [Xenopus laevis]
MAAAADLRDELNCSVCLDIYTDPVMLQCGHNFCLSCIKSVVASQGNAGAYTCPECRVKFKGRPAVYRNRKLSNIAGYFHSSQAEQYDSWIMCSYCHSPVPAVKTCLQCEASLCESHLKKHTRSPEHILFEPTTSLDSRKCPIHKELLKYYCLEHDTCICTSCCLVGEHRGHQVERLNETSEKTKAKLASILSKMTAGREEVVKNIQTLTEQMRDIQERSARVADRITAFFGDLREHLQRIESQIQLERSLHQDEALRHISKLIQQLEKKKADLCENMRHLEEVCIATDPLTVLREGQLTCHEEDVDDQKQDVEILSAGDMDDTAISITLQRNLHNLTDIISALKTKRGFSAYEETDVLFDVGTAGNHISVSDNLKTAFYCVQSQSRPCSANRFTSNQILSTRSFDGGQHYWEVESSQSRGWSVGVAYPSLKRRGIDACLGLNEKSWCVCVSGKDLSAMFNSSTNTIDRHFQNGPIGIYLDYDAGLLSFYKVHFPIRHLHTFTATFTEPLCAAFFIDKDERITITSS